MHYYIAAILFLIIHSVNSSLLPDTFAYPSYRMQFNRPTEPKLLNENAVQFKMYDSLLQCTFSDQIKQATINDQDITSAIMSLEPLKSHCIYKVVFTYLNNHSLFQRLLDGGLMKFVRVNMLGNTIKWTNKKTRNSIK